MTGNGPAFADTPARTWQLIISSVLDFIVIALIVTAVTLWASAGDLPRTLTMSLGTLVVAVSHAPGHKPRPSSPGAACSRSGHWIAR